MNYLNRAYLALWRNRAAIGFLALRAVLIGSAAGVAAAALLAPEWIPLPAAYFAGAVLLLRFAPDGENGGGS